MRSTCRHIVIPVDGKKIEIVEPFYSGLKTGIGKTMSKFDEIRLKQLEEISKDPKAKNMLNQFVQKNPETKKELDKFVYKLAN